MIRELFKEVTFKLRHKGKEVASLAESVGTTCAKAWRLGGTGCIETRESKPAWLTLGERYWVGWERMQRSDTEGSQGIERIFGFVFKVQWESH